MLERLRMVMIYVLHARKDMLLVSWTGAVVNANNVQKQRHGTLRCQHWQLRKNSVLSKKGSIHRFRVKQPVMA